MAPHPNAKADVNFSRYIDYIAAQEIFGWSKVDWCDFRGLGGIPPGETRMRNVPQFDSDAGADFKVLQKIRADWTNETQVQFRDKLWLIWTDHELDDEVPWCENKSYHYRPGDFTIAALVALGVQTIGPGGNREV